MFREDGRVRAVPAFDVSDIASLPLEGLCEWSMAAHPFVGAVASLSAFEGGVRVPERELEQAWILLIMEAACLMHRQLSEARSKRRGAAREGGRGRAGRATAPPCLARLAGFREDRHPSWNTGGPTQQHTPPVVSFSRH
jgi:hypothetical protein